ncbi:hypothetical protein HK104_007268, partial [Borealophlyctis nickersoniae]
IKAGLAERRGTPMSADEWVRKLEEVVREQNRQIALLRKNQLNEAIGFAYPRLSQKRVRTGESSRRVQGRSGWVQVAERGESSGREEWNGRDDSGDDELESHRDGSPDTDVDMDNTGGELPVATNTVGIVSEGGNTREEIERELRAEYDRKMKEQVQKLKDEGERQVAARLKEFETKTNRMLAEREKEIQRKVTRDFLEGRKADIDRKMDAYQKNYDAEKAKLTDELHQATDAAEKEQLQSKLDTAKKNYDAYVKRNTEAINVLMLQIKSLDETEDLGGPSTIALE